jgi:hypothetical protein
MKTGIMGYKGRVHLQFGRPINDKLEKLDKEMDKSAIFSNVASIIDREIHLNYLFFTHNYIAYDLMTDSHTFMHKYSMVDKHNFEKYITRQVDKIEVANKDEAFLRSTIIVMYGNTLKNYLEALEK